MNDCTKDILWEPNLIIKQEPLLEATMNTSASVPIPTRKDDYRNDFGLDLDNSDSPLYTGLLDQFQASDSYGDSLLWHGRLTDTLKSEALIHMDEDDIFQVDKADLIQGPTLAELNANDETLLGDLNFDDLLLPEGTTYITIGKNMQINSSNHNNNESTYGTSCPKGFLYYRGKELPTNTPETLDGYGVKNIGPSFSSASLTSSNSSLVQSSSSPQNINSMSHKLYTMSELLKQENFEPNNILGQSVPSQGTPLTAANIQSYKNDESRLSSSAPTHLGLEQIWQRREPRKHLLSTSSLVEAGSTSSISTSGILSPDPQDLSHDELDSEEESDVQYEDFSSENGDSDDDDEPNKHQSKRDRFFWQYNVQAKGPKGQRLVMKAKLEDPHVLNEVQDPVFSPDCSLRGIKHSGKARKGDGNDLTPNPRKLANIGKELDNLAKVINDMTPVNELPFNVRPTSRKEKNKLASRACRLKKKAQHEANKIKLSGLEIEHRIIMNSIEQVKLLLIAKYRDKGSEKQEEYQKNLEKIAKHCQKVRIAGCSTDYVNKILEKYKPAQTIIEDL